MKRLQIMSEEEFDAALERQALEEGTSKTDSPWPMVGVDDYEPGEPGEIDAVVYW